MKFLHKLFDATRSVAMVSIVIFSWMTSLAFSCDTTTQDDKTAQTDSTETSQNNLNNTPNFEQKGLIRLSKEDQVWIDLQRKLVVVEGKVCLRKGQLEMFACPKQTKEHESIVAVNSKAYVIHTALLAVGAKAGSPVKFVPKYEVAQGPKVTILVTWLDAKGKRKKMRAQEWIKNVKTKQTMSEHWVFAGSGFWTDETTGEQWYYAEGGELICVSNFPSALLDIPIKSSDGADQLLFEAYTENIPPQGTRVHLVLKPEAKKSTTSLEPDKHKGGNSP